MEKSEALKHLIVSGETLVMPDAYDPMSARIIERAGFKAVQCSGYSMALAMSIPSEAALGFERNLTVTRRIAEAVDIPVMADGEDGFGDPAAVAATVKAYTEAGAAGINLEDQVLGGAGPKAVVPAEAMVEKVKAARRAASDSGNPRFVLNGRTDALAVASARADGLREAIRRANLYLEAGADLAFVTAVADLEEARTLVKAIRGPVSIAAGLPYNIQRLSIADLRRAGVARVSLPSLAVFSAIRSMTCVMESLRKSDGFEEILEKNLICSAEDVKALSCAGRR